MAEMEEGRVREIIENIGDYNECAWLDFKLEPYDISSKNPQGNHCKKELVKDVIAMLNAKESIGRDKFIIMGVTDRHYRKGIEGMLDDSRYQSFIKSAVRPVPVFRFGEVTVQVEEELRNFGFCFISHKNRVEVYEARKDIQDSANNRGKVEGIYEGQAFVRQGSSTVIMTEADRQVLRNWGQYAQLLLEAAIFGQWDEENAADKNLISFVVGNGYDDWIRELRQLQRKEDWYFSQLGLKWKIRHKRDIFEIAGAYLDEAYLWKLERKGKELFADASLSPEIREGIAEFLAVLFLRRDLWSDEFQEVRKNLGDVVRDYLRKLFLGGLIQRNDADYFVRYLAITQPDYFLESVERQCKAWEQRGQKFDGKMNVTIDCLIEALGWIAYFGDGLSFALLCLLNLGTWREYATHRVADILMPWAPQTKASSVVRIKAVESLAALAQSERLWEILKEMWPGMNRSTLRIGLPETLCEENFEGALLSDVAKEESAYVKLSAVLFLKNPNQEKALLFLHNLPYFDNAAFSAVEDALSVYVRGIEENEKLEGWKILRMREEKELREERLRQVFKPENPLWQDAIWFSEAVSERRKYGFNDIVEKRKKIAQKYYPDGMKRLEAIADMVSIPEGVGLALAWTLSEEEQLRFMETECPNKTFSTIQYGFFQGMAEKAKQAYLNELRREGRSVFSLPLLVTYPLAPRYWKTAEKISGDEAENYWRRVFVYSFDGGKNNTAEDNLHVIKRMISTGRYQDAVWVMRSILQGNAPIDCEALERCLLQIGEKTEESRQKDQNAWLIAAEVIMLLPEAETEKDLLISVEKEYADELRRFTGGRARAFDDELAQNPDYFVESLLSILSDEVLERNHLSREREDKTGKEEVLFMRWSRAPGIDSQGKWSAEHFAFWFGRVKARLSVNPEIYEIAQYYIGQCIARAQDRSGDFGMERGLAKLLEDEKNMAIRRGYFIATLNNYSGNWTWERGRNFIQSGIKWSEEEGYFVLGRFLKKIDETFEGYIVDYMRDSRATNFAGH